MNPADPIRIGIVGCGAIAQVHHLPNLTTLKDLFEIRVVCDLSSSLAETIASDFHVPRHVTDYREVLAADIDAVLLCHGDPKTEIGLAALEAGKHLFIEKPVCFTLSDADAMIAAAACGAGESVMNLRNAGMLAQTKVSLRKDPVPSRVISLCSVPGLFRSASTASRR